MTRSPCPEWAGSPPGRTQRGIPSASGRRTQRRRKGEPLDRPGVAGLEERRYVALLFGARRRELLGHQVVVDRALDVSEDPDRGRIHGGLGQAAKRERRTRLDVVCVMDEQLRLVRYIDDLHAAIPTLPDAPLILLTEPNRLPVLEVDPVRLVLADEVERAVVVDVAVLEDLDERAPAMRGCGSQRFRQMRTIGVDRAGDERRLCADRQ